MSTKTPCQTGNPEDWFIGKDGKQYRDDEVLTFDEMLAAAAPLFANHGKPGPDEVLAAKDAAEEEKIRQALIRRRKARDACYDCPVRLACLDTRLEQKVEFGTWGGYYEEQLRLLDIERERQRLRHP